MKQARDKYHTVSLTCGIENMTQVILSTKQTQTEKTDTDRENRLAFAKGKGRREKGGVGVWG